VVLSELVYEWLAVVQVSHQALKRHIWCLPLLTRFACIISIIDRALLDNFFFKLFVD